MDGNKLRDLLRGARSFIECSPLKTVESSSGCLARDRICDDIDAALAEPGRNCDLPDPRKRFKEFCDGYSMCTGCPYDLTEDDELFSCEAQWLLDEAKEEA